MLEPGDPPERVTEQDWAQGKDWRGTAGAAPERPVLAWVPQRWVITASDPWRLEIRWVLGEPGQALAQQRQILLAAPETLEPGLRLRRLVEALVLQWQILPVGPQTWLPGWSCDGVGVFSVLRRWTVELGQAGEMTKPVLASRKEVTQLLVVPQVPGPTLVLRVLGLCSLLEAENPSLPSSRVSQLAKPHGTQARVPVQSWSQAWHYHSCSGPPCLLQPPAAQPGSLGFWLQLLGSQEPVMSSAISTC